jgi:predicted nucleotidyltransferase component of viral defense system
MPVSNLHRQVAGIVLRAARQHGFALAGGNALIAHGIIDRFTQDVDLFTDRQGGVEAAAEAVESALRAAGFQAEPQDKTAGLTDIWDGMGEGLAEWAITAPDGEQTTLQMAYFDRSCKPVTMDVGPVLDLEDLVGWKVSALVSRVEPRDYVDTAAALERYTAEQLIGIARKLDPGLTDQDFADAGRRLDQLGDRRFAALGLGPQDIARLRKRFAAWPRTSPQPC